MKDIANKTDNVDELPANGFNSIVDELENAVTDSGQTLDASSETTPDPSPTQLSRAITEASQSADFYTDSGAADAYVLTAAGNWRQSTAYRNGQHFRFLPTNANTGASTINVSGLGVKTLENVNGTALNANQLDPTRVALVYYNSSADKFKLIDPTFGQDAGGAVASYVTNFGAETGTEGWATYADTAASTPVDGTGGTPTITWSRVTSNPLVGIGSFLFTKDAVNRQGEGASYDFVLPRGYRDQDQSLSLIWEVVTGTYTDGDIAVFLYDVDGATLITPEESSLFDKATANLITTRFVLPNPTSVNYRFIVHQASTTTNGYTVKFDQVIIINETQNLAFQERVNLIANPNGEIPLNRNQTNDIGDYIDSGAGVTASITETSSEIPLYPLKKKAIKLSFAAGTSTYNRYRFQVPISYRNKILGLKWEHITDTFANGEVKVELYRYPDAYISSAEEVPLQSDDSSGDTFIKPGSTFFNSAFNPNTYEYYELRWVNSGATSGFLSMNEISIDDGDVSISSILTEGEDVSGTLTFSAGFGTLAAEEIFRKQKGASYIYEGSVTLGTVGATVNEITLPFNIDTSKLPTNGTNIHMIPGYAQRQQTTAEWSNAGFKFYWAVNSATPNKIYFRSASASNTSFGASAATNSILGTGNTVFFRFEVPVQGLKGDSLTPSEALMQNSSIRVHSDNLVLSTTPTAVTFDTIGHNDGGGFSYNAGIITCLFDGKVAIGAALEAASGSGGVVMIADIFKNGTSIAHNQVKDSGSVSVSDPAVKVAYGDTLEIRASATGGTPTLALVADGTYFSVSRLPDRAFQGLGLMIPNGTVRLDAGNGFGSTATKIRRWTNSSVVGDAFTYTANATNGDFITVNKDCIASITYADRNSAGTTQIGISLNASGADLTTNIIALTDLDKKLVAEEVGSALRGSVSLGSYKFSKGDIIRAHGSGDANDTGDSSYFRIQETYRLG